MAPPTPATSGTRMELVATGTELVSEVGMSVDPTGMAGEMIWMDNI